MMDELTHNWKPVNRHPTKMPHRERLRDAGDRTVRFVRAFTDGVDQKGVQRLFDREATQAFDVLTGRLEREKRGHGPMAWATGMRDVLMGMAFKLSPPRRLLFATALLIPLLGLFDASLSLGATRVSIDFSPVWFLAGFTLMTLLLALELVDRLRVRDELEVARQIQRDLLPQELPEMPGYRVAHSSKTANEIGGDYYDFLPLGDGRMALVVGDASGHGIAAGLLMAIVHATFRSTVASDPEPVAVLSSINRVLCCTGGPRAFMTLFYGVLELDTGHLQFASSGHPFPLLRRAASGDVVEIGQSGLPLGLRHPLPLTAEEVTIEVGDSLVLFSDGLPETLDRDDNAFTFERLAQLVAGGGMPSTLHDGILAAVARHQNERPLTDDFTLVVLGRNAPNTLPPPPPDAESATLGPV